MSNLNAVHEAMVSKDAATRKAAADEGMGINWDPDHTLLMALAGHVLGREPTEELPASPTWPHVLAFARKMEKKLDQNRHKGDRPGWLSMSEGQLFNRLVEELGEVAKSLQCDEPARTIMELADVANFCMMLADKIEESQRGP